MGNFISDFYKSPVGKTAAFGFASNLLGGDSKEIQPQTDYPYLSAGKLYDWANTQSDKYAYDPAAAYSGKLSADLTPTETNAQNMLTNYMGSETPSSLTEANKYNTSVLSGGYDPTTSPYYAAMKKQILKDSEEASAAVRHGAATSGMLHSDPRHEGERKLTENISDQIAQLLGGLYESERNRMSTAAGQSTGIANALSQIPLQKITAGSTIGAVPREVEQADLDRTYQEFLRQLEGKSEPYNVYSGLSGKSYQPYAAQPYSTGQDTTSQFMQIAMQALPLILTAFSDKRLKNNIEYIEGSPVKDLSLATWEWNYKGNEKGLFGKSIGFIAQDVEKIYPEAIEYSEDGYLMINYSKLPLNYKKGD